MKRRGLKGRMQGEKIVAIIPAAGLGKRFGHENNKPFYPLLDKPLIIWSLEVLQDVEEIDEIIPVLKEEDLIIGSELIEKYNIAKVKRIVPGGKERQDSVNNGIKMLDDNTSVVMVHDGVRPLVKKDLIKRLIKEIELSVCDDKCKREFDGVVAGVPVKDTIKECNVQDVKCASKDENIYTVKKTLDRGVLRAIQTPQVFYFQKIKDVYEKATADRYYATDDAALVERYGGKIKVIMGSYKNIKVTTPEDIRIAEALLKVTHSL